MIYIRKVIRLKMGDSFVVKTSGGVETHMLHSVAGFLIPEKWYDLVKSGTSGIASDMARKVVNAVLIVGLILMIWLIWVNGAYAISQGVTMYSGAKETFSSRYPYGAGVAGTRETRFGGPIGISGDVQGMANKKYDTFLNGSEAPVFQDVPNYILRKENTMQDAVKAYANLRSKKGNAAGSAVPDWAEYWKDWQSNSGSDFNRDLYDTSSLGTAQGMSNLRDKVY